jgi:hypothetical protein
MSTTWRDCFACFSLATTWQPHGGLVAAVTLLAATVAAIAYLVSFEAISAYVARIGALPA